MFSEKSSNYDKQSNLSVWQKGFVEGKFSDITVNLFSNCLHLHKIILISNSFFNAMITGGPWIESGSDNISLSFDDPYISFQGLYFHV
jgi:hypothetical protein